MRHSVVKATIVVNPTMYKKTDMRLKVPDLNGKFIKYKEEGTVVPKSVYYTRLIKCGDLEIVKAKKVTINKTKPKTEKE